MLEKLTELFAKYKAWVIALGIGVLVGGGVLYVLTSFSKNDESFQQFATNKVTQKTKAKTAKVANSKEIYVDIKGAVKQPGLYRISPLKRVGDALALAGGVTDQADISQVNYAKKLSDQMLIYVARKGESSPVSAMTSTTSAEISNSAAKLDLNTATKEQLMQIDGVGEKRATKIIEYREKNGGFKQLSDLKNISGIGERTYQKLVEHLEI